MRNVIAEMNIDVEVVIPAIQDLIQQEKTTLEANKLLKNPEKYLEDDYRISNLQKLTCFLIKCS